MKKPTNSIPRLISVAELAERLGVSGKTISRWIRSGELHSHRLGRQIRITEDDVHAFVAARRG